MTTSAVSTSPVASVTDGRSASALTALASQLGLRTAPCLMANSANILRKSLYYARDLELASAVQRYGKGCRIRTEMKRKSPPVSSNTDSSHSCEPTSEPLSTSGSCREFLRYASGGRKHTLGEEDACGLDGDLAQSVLHSPSVQDLCRVGRNATPRADRALGA